MKLEIKSSSGVVPGARGKCAWCHRSFAVRSKTGKQRFCNAPQKCRQEYWAYQRPVARIHAKNLRIRHYRDATVSNTRRVTRLAIRLAGQWLKEREGVMHGFAGRRQGGLLYGKTHRDGSLV
jgi:hypothetical protein